MQEVLDQLLSYARGIWRFRWYIHAIAWPVCIMGWLVVNSLPDEYQASAKVYVDTKSMLRPLLRGLAAQSNIEEEVQVVTRTLLSQPNLEKVARMTDMDLGAKTPEDMEEVIDKLRHTIKFTGGRDNLFDISYVDDSQQLSKQVVQSLLTIFVESSLGDSRKDTDTAQKFLDQQILEYEQKLFEAEERLKEFKQRNVGMMPGQGQDYFSQLVDAKRQLELAQLQYREAANRRDELKRQIAGEEPTFGIVPSTTSGVGAMPHPLDGRIQGLDQKLDELLLRYTEQHPDVISTRDTMARLKKQREDELKTLAAKMPAGAAIPGVDTNPVYQQLKIALGQAEADVASLQVRVDQYRRDLDRLERQVNTVPAVEAEMQRLNRDYAVNKQNYDALVARREQAKMAVQAEQTAEDVKFRIIDPPRVTPEPVGPNRPLFISVVLIGGLLAGFGFAFFLSQIKPIFDTTRSLRDFTNLPVFGAVSLVYTDRQIRMRKYEFAVFVASAFVLVIFYGFVVSGIASYHIPLDAFQRG